MQVEGLSIAESLRFASVVATSMILFFSATCSYYLERRNGRRPMFALIFLLIGWCSLTLGAATSGVGRHFHAILVFAPFLSGYLGPTLFICTKQLTNPYQKVSLKFLFLGGFGTLHSILALTLPDGLDPAVQSILYKKPYYHPILSSIMFIHGAQLIGFTVYSTFLITRAYVKKSNPDLRRTQFWLMTVCWTGLIIMFFTNVLPTFSIIITEIQPALIMVPIAFVGALSIKALGEEAWEIHSHRIEERNYRLDSLGRMARGLAHDLNNILSTILGHAEIAKIKSDKSVLTLSHLDQIIFGTQRASRLLERMLVYSGHQYSQGKPIKPENTIRSIFESVSTIQEDGVTMFLKVDPELPVIHVDESELASIIENLLQNGLNALNNQKGRLTVRVSSEESTQLPPDFVGHDLNGLSALRVEVEDTGQGMPKEEAARVLEPFFSTNASGKGLGLVNVLSAIKGAGGALWFQSEFRVGTRFVFWIPEASEKTQDTQLSEINDALPVRVILVEDDLDVAKVLIPMLRNIGIRVEHYKESQEVMDLIQSNTIGGFDIGILDIRLGGVDGIELGHHLLNNQILKALLFISGDEPGIRIKQFDGNPVLFLRKPIGLEQLENSMRRLFGAAQENKPVPDVSSVHK